MKVRITILSENLVGRVVGLGEHGFSALTEQLEESIRFLKEINVTRIGVSHCTGLRAAFRLQQEFGDRFFYGWVGSGLEV